MINVLGVDDLCIPLRWWSNPCRAMRLPRLLLPPDPTQHPAVDAPVCPPVCAVRPLHGHRCLVVHGAAATAVGMNAVCFAQPDGAADRCGIFRFADGRLVCCVAVLDDLMRDADTPGVLVGDSAGQVSVLRLHEGAGGGVVLAARAVAVWGAQVLAVGATSRCSAAGAVAVVAHSGGGRALVALDIEGGARTFTADLARAAPHGLSPAQPWPVIGERTQKGGCDATAAASLSSSTCTVAVGAVAMLFDLRVQNTSGVAPLSVALTPPPPPSSSSRGFAGRITDLAADGNEAAACDEHGAVWRWDWRSAAPRSPPSPPPFPSRGWCRFAITRPAAWEAGVPSRAAVCSSGAGAVAVVPLGEDDAVGGGGPVGSERADLLQVAGLRQCGGVAFVQDGSIFVAGAA